jgi:hypothetical protein
MQREMIWNLLGGIQSVLQEAHFVYVTKRQLRTEGVSFAVREKDAGKKGW